jgi:hypothetical protein
MARTGPVLLIAFVPSFLSLIGTAQAQTLYPEPQQRFSAGSGGYADTIGNRSIYADGTFAPRGIYQSGFRFQVTGSENWYRFVTDQTTGAIGKGRSLDGGFLVGYGIWFPRFNIDLFVGPAFGEVVNDGPKSDRWGAKAAASMSTTPTDLTMFSTSASYSTVANNLQAQAKAGLKILGPLYFGPEAGLFWQRILPWETNFASIMLGVPVPTFTTIKPQTNIATYRLGAHISALSFGPAVFGISGGWTHQQQLGSGYYGTANLYLPF